FTGLPHVLPDEILHLHVGQIAKGFVSLMTGMYGYYRFYGQCMGVISFAVRKYMQVGNVKGMQKVEGFFEIFFGFSREPNDYIHADGAMWHKRFDQFHPLRIQFLFITTAHQTQYLVTTTLQRDMKMRHKLIAVRHEFDDLVC